MKVWQIFVTAVVVTLAVVSGPRSGGSDAALLTCRSQSVNETSYVAHNEAILSALPVPHGAQLLNTQSYGKPATNACLPHENGPPYSSFATVRTYSLAISSRVGALQWFESALTRQAWTIVSGSPASYSLTLHRGISSLSIQTWQGAKPRISLSVDFDFMRKQ